MSSTPAHYGQPLSPREVEVCERLVCGKRDKMIAHELNLSPRTVQLYRARIFKKKGVGNAVELCRLVLAEQQKNAPVGTV
jgi:two-component system response regulator FixJ